MDRSLIVQLGLATTMVVVTVLVHLAGLMWLLRLMRIHRNRLMTPLPRLNDVLIVLGVAFGLFALHTLEIWAYAVAFRLLDATPTFEEALYFSTTTYATIGYGDVTLQHGWRILGAIEGANGVILLGWSTAFFVSVVQRLRTLEDGWLEQGSGPPSPRPQRPASAPRR